MKLLLATLLLPLSTLCAPTFSPIRFRQSAQIQITSFSAAGPGCPQGTISSSISDDGTTLTLGFDAYQTDVGPGVSDSPRELNCDIFATLRYPLGCTSASVRTTYHGFAELDEGVRGTFPAAYTLSPGEATGTSPLPATFSGAPGFVYTKLDEVRVKENIRNQNQRDVSLAVRTRVFLQAANETVSGTLTVDDATIAVTGQGC